MCETQKTDPVIPAGFKPLKKGQAGIQVQKNGFPIKLGKTILLTFEVFYIFAAEINIRNIFNRRSNNIKVLWKILIFREF